jgi:hypothetical protein
MKEFHWISLKGPIMDKDEAIVTIDWKTYETLPRIVIEALALYETQPKEVTPEGHRFYIPVDKIDELNRLATARLEKCPLCQQEFFFLEKHLLKCRKKIPDMNEQQLREKFPALSWNEPISIVVLGKGRRLGCRLCIAMYGLKAQDLEKLMETEEEFQNHLLAIHGVKTTEETNGQVETK